MTMMANPYETNSVLRHDIVHEDDEGFHTACGLLAGWKIRFEGFEPRACPECHAAHDRVAVDG